MIAWMPGAFAGPMVLAGFGVYLCRRRRRHRRLTCEQIAESEVFADLERRENRNHPAPDHQRPGRLSAPGTAAMASPAPGFADLVHGRRPEKLVAWSGVQRTAPAVPPAVDVAIRPSETGFGTAAGAKAKMTRRRAFAVVAGAGVAAGIGVTACDKSQHQQVSPGLKSPQLRSASLTGTSMKGTSLKAPGIWRFQTPGSVVEGLVAVKGVVYTADDNDNGGSHSHNVYALDARTGAAIWAAANYAESYTGPAVGNDLVYVGSDFHTVTALHAGTGHMAWQYVTGDVGRFLVNVANHRRAC
jgi:PQQ-like domain